MLKLWHDDCFWFFAFQAEFAPSDNDFQKAADEYTKTTLYLRHYEQSVATGQGNTTNNNPANYQLRSRSASTAMSQRAASMGGLSRKVSAIVFR